jgi:tetratricopeptide (TPR) repeat protein
MTPPLLSRFGSARWAALLLLLLVLLAIPAAAIGHRLYVTRVDYLVDNGTAALKRHDVAEAERTVRVLETKGHESAAHVLRGQILLHQARAALQEAPRPFPYEGIQQATQLFLATAGLSDAPAVLRGANWTAAGLVQKPFRRPIPGAEDLHDALHEFAQVLDDDPWAAQATVLASECLVRLEERRPAARALTALVKRQPDNVDAHRWLAVIYIDLNSPGPAIEHLQEWARLDPNNPRPYRWLGFFTRDGLFTGDPARPVDSVEAYRNALKLGLDPRDQSTVLHELAETLMNLRDDYAAALETLDSGSRAFQDQPAIRVQRAHCLIQLDRKDEAVQILEEVLRSHPKTKPALSLRARLHMQEDQPRAAVPLLEKLLTLDPNDPVTRQNLMLAYGALREDKRAAEQKRLLDALVANQERLIKLRQETARNPWNARARYQLALAYAADSRAEALTWIQAAFACDSEDSRIRKAWTQLVGYQPPTLSRLTRAASKENQ